MILFPWVVVDTAEDFKPRALLYSENILGRAMEKHDKNVVNAFPSANANIHESEQPIQYHNSRVG